MSVDQIRAGRAPLDVLAAPVWSAEWNFYQVTAQMIHITKEFMNKMRFCNFDDNTILIFVAEVTGPYLEGWGQEIVPYPMDERSSKNENALTWSRFRKFFVFGTNRTAGNQIFGINKIYE